MDFEEMKVIWDQQTAQPLYAVNEAALHRGIRKNARDFRWLILVFESIMVAVPLGLSVFYITQVLIDGQNYDRLVSAAILLATAAFFFAGIRHRWQRERTFEPTLLGDLNKALWEIEYQTARARRLRWTYILPFCLAVLIDFAFPLHEPKAVVPFLLFLALMMAASWAIEYEIRCWYAPKQRKLTALQEILTTPGEPETVR